MGEEAGALGCQQASKSWVWRNVKVEVAAVAGIQQNSGLAEAQEMK